MLVICNGAYKSGSTWLFNIATTLSRFDFPPEPYRNKAWRNPSIDPVKLGDFLRSVDITGRNYISKQHLSAPPERDLILGTADVRVLDIERDLRDVLVSAYYHHRRDGRFVGSFEDFYWTEGRLIAHQVQCYHALWRGREERVFVASYERLHADFAGEVERLAAFLGLEVAPGCLQSVRAETTIDRLRAKYGEADKPAEQQFFRKGVVGSWQDHFTPRLLDDLRDVEENGLTWSQQMHCKVKTKLHRALRAYPRKLRAGAERADQGTS